ncbi:hypothetical protein [Streptococcus hyointestinalis]|uniref:hypothetical protein n=1 Tax=Streptococcus hyointestinalis TaxID=1337 RepID=UPI0013DF72C2|nr:hypothetical protein [Streptococcus hyointestinalis]
MDLHDLDKPSNRLGGGGAATAIIAPAAKNGAKKITIIAQTLVRERTQAYAKMISQKTEAELEVLLVADHEKNEEKPAQLPLFGDDTSVSMDGKSRVIKPHLNCPEHLMEVDDH